MARAGRWIVLSIAILLGAGLLFISPVLLFAGSNAAAGLYTLLFEKQPAEAQLLGTYKYEASWGTTTLLLSSANQFEELLETKDGSKKSIRGTWGTESADMGHAAGVTFRPYIDLEDETHGRQLDYGEILFYRPIFGQTYGEINGDTGARFTKRQ